MLILKAKKSFKKSFCVRWPKKHHVSHYAVQSRKTNDLYCFVLVYLGRENEILSQKNNRIVHRFWSTRGLQLFHKRKLSVLSNYYPIVSLFAM